MKSTFADETMVHQRCNGTMTVYKDFSITAVKYLLKLAGAWITENDTEKLQRKISLTYMTIGLLYGVYGTILNLYYKWGDVNACVFLLVNMGCITLAIIKMVVTNILRKEFTEIIEYAKRNFWHYNYNAMEQNFLFECQLACKSFMIFIYIFLFGCVSGYAMTPVIWNIGLNKTDRDLLYQEWIEISETPYFELMYFFQVLCVNVIGIGYATFDTFLCVLNAHVICQFRILQYRLLNVWNSVNEKLNTAEYTRHCNEQLRSCVRQHQMLIEYCGRIENVYTLMNGSNILILGFLFSFDCYEIFLADVSTAQMLIFVCNLVGSFLPISILMYTCHRLMDESMDIVTTVYSGSWLTLPMDKIGRTLRTNVRIIMIRSLRPCCLTAAGFFPLTLKTVTTLMSTVFSYFTLIRESTT